MLAWAIIIDCIEIIFEQNMQAMAVIELSCILMIYSLAIINRFVTYNGKWCVDAINCILFLSTGYVTGTIKILSFATVFIIVFTLCFTTLLTDFYSKIKMSKWYWDGSFVLLLLLIGCITGTLSSLLSTLATIVISIFVAYVVLLIICACGILCNNNNKMRYQHNDKD